MRLIRHLHKFLQGSTTRKQHKLIPHPIVWSFWLSAAELPAMRRSLAAYKSVDTIHCTRNLFSPRRATLPQINF